MTPRTPGIAQRIDALLPFLPVMEARVAGDWRGGDRNAGGTITMPWFDYNDEILSFVRACAANGWIEPYDWQAWQARALEYYRNQDLLRKASLSTLQRLLTLHVRKDRFFEGHLASAIESGHLAGILHRLTDLRARMGHGPSQRPGA